MIRCPDPISRKGVYDGARKLWSSNGSLAINPSVSMLQWPQLKGSSNICDALLDSSRRNPGELLLSEVLFDLRHDWISVMKRYNFVKKKLYFGVAFINCSHCFIRKYTYF
jgi:hypothetical protein